MIVFISVTVCQVFSDGMKYLLRLFPPVCHNINVWMLIWPLPCYYWTPASMLFTSRPKEGSCSHLQEEIYQALHGGPRPEHVAIFGNADPAQKGGWTRILGRNCSVTVRKPLLTGSSFPTSELTGNKAKTSPPSVCIYHIKRNGRNQDCLRSLLQVAHASNLFSWL